ncbi:MAG: hypothetical protein AB1778_00790 [Candidatus Bipolaricaulota bacterium]
MKSRKSSGDSGLPAAQGRRSGRAAKRPLPYDAEVKEGTVSKIVCPVCDAAFDVDKEELSLFNRLRCEECEALLEVVEEDPVRLEWIEEEDDFDDDEDLDDEEDDDYL